MINDTHSFSSHLDLPYSNTMLYSNVICFLKWSQIKTGIVNREGASVAKTGEDWIRSGKRVVVSSCYCIWRKLTLVLLSVPQLHFESSINAAQPRGLVKPERYTYICLKTVKRHSLNKICLLYSLIIDCLIDWEMDWWTDWVTEWLKRETLKL